MKKLDSLINTGKKTILSLVGAAVLAGCATIPKQSESEKFQELMLKQIPDGIMMEYDTNIDGVGDLRYLYQFLDQDWERIHFVLRLMQIDKNRDEVYEENEIVKLEKKYSNLYLDFLPDGAIVEYDTDGDGAGDLRYLYQFIDEYLGSFHFRLTGICKDKDKNGIYDRSEMEVLPTENMLVTL